MLPSFTNKNKGLFRRTRVLTHKLSFLQNHTPGVQTKTNDFMFGSKSEWLTRQLCQRAWHVPHVFLQVSQQQARWAVEAFQPFFDKSNG